MSDLGKIDFEKDFRKYIVNSVVGKTMENVRKHRDIKVITTNKRTIYLLSEPNYHTTKLFSECLLAIEMNKTKVKMNKPVYLGLSIYYENNDKPLPICKNKKVIGLIKDELGGKIITEFVALKPKACYLMDDVMKLKKVKEKKCVRERLTKFNDYIYCLLYNKTALKSQQRVKSYGHNVYTEVINKTALSSDDDKNLQTFDNITTYPYGASVGKVCKRKLLKYLNINY